MFRKILIANRGEVAIRILRACREMGIPSVAVYSEADRNALHVRLADQAFLLGPASPLESYLSIPRLMGVAHLSGADAIHPGYGFLSENPNLARTCQEEGIGFIGPTAEVLEKAGNKVEARRLMKEAGLPIIPGTLDGLAGEDEAFQVAGELGYPVLLKAAGGGGGKGMRIVHDASEMLPAIRTARNEAKMAFGDSTLYVEKLISRARHIEMQILADAQGNMVYLGERECSIQRRHQKLVEEAPSPVMGPEDRRTLGKTVLRGARAIGYVGAGTFEFLRDQEGHFYFLEVNPRLQVEHPVTEMVTGIDIVKEQIRLAAGEPLRFKQEDIQVKGWAIECRLYAEDPENIFMPSPGTIWAMVEPSGPGVRVESSAFVGLSIPTYYDPLLSKVVVWAETRVEAINRMRRALQEYYIMGVNTTAPFHRFVMEDAAFLSGDFDTGFIHREWGEKTHRRERMKGLAALAAALVASQKGLPSTGARLRPQAAQESAWKSHGRRAMLRGY